MPPLRVPPEMFRFTTGDRAELYIALLQAFGEANERLETSLGLDEVRTRLRSVGWLDALDDGDLTDTLQQLRAWNMLDVIQNHAQDYRSAADYERRNLQYSLTRQGEAALAGVSHAIMVLASAGALQTAVLDAIADRLRDVVQEYRQGADRRLYTALTEMEGHLEALRANTVQFNGELQRLLRADGTDLATFHDVKAATVAYLQEFLTNSDRRRRAIVTGITAAEELGVALIHQRALLGAELPKLPGADPAPAWLEHRRARWAGLRAWFDPDDGAAPRVEQLHQVARTAIITLLQVLDRISESRRRTSSAAADFRELARWFSVTGSQGDLHRLWSTMFGLSPSRHAHLPVPDPELAGPSTPWRDAPPAEVSPLLRSAGRTERFSRTGRVRDVAAIRKIRAERARAERAELEAAWSMLDTGGIVRLAAFGSLDHALFERLLELLGRALAASPGPAGLRRGCTADGRIEILLTPPPDGATATLVTPCGRFTGPDYEIEVRVPGVRPAGRPHLASTGGAA